MPPPRSPSDPAITPRDRRKAATFHRILSAARQVFFEEGFRGASLEKVAMRAGVAKGTLYRHIETKAELYVEVLISHVEVLEERLREATRGSQTATEKLQTLARFYLDYFSRRSEYLPLFWAVDNQQLIGELPRELVRRLSEATRVQLRILEGVILEGIEREEFVECDAWVMANVLWKLADAYLEVASSPTRRGLLDRPVEALFREGFELVLRGLCRH